MKTVRENIFETNSSSTHALEVCTPQGKDYTSEGKYLKIRWFDEEETLVTLEEKVSYLVSHIASWYKYDAPDYEALIEEIKNNYEFKEMEEFIKNKFNKEIVFPKTYEGDLEDIVEINHQLTSWSRTLDEVLEDMVNREEDRNLLEEVLADGKCIRFGRD